MINSHALYRLSYWGIWYKYDKSRRSPIFPRRHHLSIFGVYELNFCVRNGNRWNLIAICTGYHIFKVSNPENWIKEVSWEAKIRRDEIRSSPRPISTCRLNMSPCLHHRPINLIVFEGSYSFDGISYLKGGFTLRCLQRLSVPHLAARLCRWHDNRCTRGASIPVLSY